MLATLRPAAERGHFDHGWLDTYHTFSFADYHDPKWMGFRSLRVINDDIIAPSGAFGMHPHRDMEIISYIVRGAIRHTDSLGHERILHAGGFQAITAGSGILHGEANGSESEPMRLIQIWIRPDARGLKPGYAEIEPVADLARDEWRIVTGPVGRAPKGALAIHQDAWLRHARLSRGATLTHEIAPTRAAWLQVVDGSVRVGDRVLSRGDGLAVESAGQLAISGVEDADVLLFDLA